MAIATILPTPRTVFLDVNNNPLSGGQVFTYVHNTTTFKISWQDAGEATPNTNPIILDSNGSCKLYGSGQYTLSVYDSQGNLIYTGLTQDLYNLILVSNNTFTGINDFTNGSILVPTATPGTDTTDAASTQFVTEAIAAAILPPSLAGAPITGMLPSGVTGSNTTASLTISSGSAIDNTNSIAIIAVGYSWAVSYGNAINGYQQGNTLPNSSTIHFFICKGTSGICSFANNSTTCSPPAGYNSYTRRIFSINTNSSGALLAGTASEVMGGAMKYSYTAPVADASSGSATTSPTAATLTVPSGIKIFADFYGSVASSLGWVLFYSPDESPTLNQSTLPYVIDVIDSAGATSVIRKQLLTNTSSQIQVVANANTTYGIYTLGFVDNRRT